jgi:DNA-binding transcriptional LysR family regulator
MLDNINLNLLRSLLVLLEETHVSRAAQRLSITQSALSRQLAQCRELFSDPLLVRNGNELQKTPKAELLQNKLDALFIEFNDLIQEQVFEPESWSGEVSFGCSDYVAQYIFPEIIERISGIANQARFTYHSWQPHLLAGFADSPIKFASTLQPTIPKGLSGKLIGEDFQVCVMAKGHPLSNKNTLTIDDVLSYQHIIITGGGEKNIELDVCLRERATVIERDWLEGAILLSCL